MKIVLTGGPGGGKTTATDFLRREFGDRLAMVPEAATLLYSGGFPRSSDPAVKKINQKVIFTIQSSLEEIRRIQFPHRSLICDRGTIDGAAYWPGHTDEFFQAMGTSLTEQLRRYDVVIFFETSAAGGRSVIEGGNPTRVETPEQAQVLDARLRELWSKHPNFHLIENNRSFLSKLTSAVELVRGILG